MIKIFDIDDDRVKLYKTLRKTPTSHIESSVFVAEGDKPVHKLLESELKIRSFFALEKYYKQYSHMIDFRVASEARFTAEKKIMDKIVGFRLHKGIMAIAEQPDDTPIDKMSSPIIILNGIVNSENVGAIVRNCVAFGIQSIIVDKKTSSPFLRRAVRVSMGAIYFLKVYHSEDITKDLLYLKHVGHKIIAAEKLEHSVSIDRFAYPEKFALILGSEGKGIDDDILSLSELTVSIPINKKIPSINVASASSIFFHKMKINK